MDHEIIFLVGVYLMPLAFVSFVSAWTHSRRPTLALTLVIIGLLLITIVAYDRPDGLYALADIPVLTARFVSRIVRLL